MDRGAWRAIVQGSQSWTWLSNLVQHIAQGLWVGKFSERKCGQLCVVCNNKCAPCIVSFSEMGILGNGFDQNCCLGHQKLAVP